VNIKSSYRFTIDLVNINDDKIKVDCITPAITKKTITYHLPRIVPGTYSSDDYGRYAENFSATDNKGNSLAVSKADVNSWVIEGADKLSHISYLVNDSFDDTARTQVIFEPAGSNIEKDSNYIINNHCFIGYFDEMKELTYEINIKHPKHLYGSTALKDVDKSDMNDRFIAESYNRIVDNPFMYNIPDTTVIRVGNTDVLVSVYSPNKKLTSQFLASKLEPLLQAQTKYLGGKLPVEKYAFIIYLTPRRGRSGAIGALEHSFSSLYFLTESSPEQLSAFFLNAAGHEFFHIITPLSIHSNEIQYFDFNDPKMSMHLWLYEGSTEYHAHMVQEKYGMITPEELLKRFTSKINSMKNTYNDTVPFTVLSKEIITKYANQFRNVYEKGALINMCLDIKLLQLSNGKHGLMKLIQDLSEKYGKQKGFNDADLFNEIEKLTYPQIRQFLDTYVAASNPLPLKEIFDIVGVNYIPYVETKDSIFSNGGATFRFSQSAGRLRVTDISKMNSLGYKLGYRLNDEVVSVNGEAITSANALNFIRNFGANAKERDSLVIQVIRKDDSGNALPVDLKATMTKFPVVKLNVLEFDANPTPQQLLIRNAWLKPGDMQKGI
jgi:predicted metalloprotease with PDZ domain